MKRLLMSAGLIIGLVAPAAFADDLNSLFMGGFSGVKLKKAIEQADKYPLGSDQNPVRVNMPQGQRAYLRRLRCADDKEPKFDRGGSVGSAPFGSMVDVYDVDCGNAAPGKVSVYLDMYHPQHNEGRAVPGFKITNER